MSSLQPIHNVLGELVKLAEDAVCRPALPLRDCEDRQDRIVAELVAICTAMPSRKALVGNAKIMSICLRKLYAARAAGEAHKVLPQESAVGFFLPYLRLDVFEALAWEREQGTP